ncbi:Arginine exporter protein ArgO [Amycolatopsis lurida]|uniref:Lysine transporter LysE n=1 Tax=Amycolatopsis lurida NRRL 2430 TaxID=1460371 RepID=A0A2P2G2R1_AMYLU|nr:LysE family transporter [Amycolatopsis lurida]KFU83270.1 lysine transporter LysE [Amycolatopsis lurida NRRL 2430]SED27155.1 Arginine exporter protein ArgO [Amycolatopsis lurida]
MSAALVAGLLAGYGIAIPVGAVATYLVVLTARSGLKIGAYAALGVATADGLYALVAVLGGGGLIPVIEPIAVPLRWTSVVVLLALAVHIGLTGIRNFRDSAKAEVTQPVTIGPVKAYVSLLGITLLNPTTVVYFAALVLGSEDMAAASGAEHVVFVAAAFAASASWQLFLAGGGAVLGKALTGRRGRLVTALASSALITVLGLRLLW